MKRSKIFLGVTTALLAIAGVTAAKSFTNSTTRYYLSINQKYCYKAAVACTQSGTTVCLYTTANPLNHVIVFTKGPDGLKQSGQNTNCTDQFFRNTNQ